MCVCVSRWIGCVGMLCMIILVQAFNVLGLLCGTCGYDKQATPTTRGCLSNTGGNLLMAYVTMTTAWCNGAVYLTAKGGVCGCLFQRGGFLFHLLLGADGHCDHSVCRRRQCGEAVVRAAG